MTRWITAASARWFNGACARGCNWSARYGNAREFELFDALPRELRDYLNEAPVDYCAHCVNLMYRQVGLAHTLFLLRREDGGPQHAPDDRSEAGDHRCQDDG
jgi:hypothetical protein